MRLAPGMRTASPAPNPSASLSKVKTSSPQHNRGLLGLVLVTFERCTGLVGVKDALEPRPRDALPGDVGGNLFGGEGGG